MDKEEMDRRNKLNGKRLKETRRKLNRSNYIINRYHTPNLFTRYISIALFGLAVIGVLYIIFKG